VQEQIRVVVVVVPLATQDLMVLLVL